MRNHSVASRLQAAALAWLAGYVDAVGFMSLGGYFVSFMSGNSTRWGVDLAGQIRHAWIAIALIATFVAGVALGTAIAMSRGTPAFRRVLVLVCAVLAAASALATFGHAQLAAFAAALGMGAVNVAFLRGGELPVGLTYMTGTLVRIGRELGSLPFGGSLRSCVPYLLHWLALVAGAAVGAVGYAWVGATALWLACVVALALACVGDRPAARQHAHVEVG